jgi:hypothetical protein
MDPERFHAKLQQFADIRAQENPTEAPEVELRPAPWPCPRCDRVLPEPAGTRIVWHRGLPLRREHCRGCNLVRDPRTGGFSLDPQASYGIYDAYYSKNLAAK